VLSPEGYAELQLSLSPFARKGAPTSGYAATCLRSDGGNVEASAQRPPLESHPPRVRGNLEGRSGAGGGPSKTPLTNVRCGLRFPKLTVFASFGFGGEEPLSICPQPFSFAPKHRRGRREAAGLRLREVTPPFPTSLAIFTHGYPLLSQCVQLPIKIGCQMGAISHQ